MSPSLVRSLASVFRFRTVPLARLFFSTLPSPCLVERRLFGHRFPIDLSRTITHQLLYLKGERNIEEVQLVQSLLKPGMCVADIGANIGYYALMVLQQIGPGGRVACVEPDRDNVAELKRVIDANQLMNVSVHHAAVGAEAGTAGIQAGLNSAVTEDSEASYQVNKITLDSLPERPFDFIKIDVEGYEGEVLRGARAVLTEDRPVLFLEFHPHLVEYFGSSMDEVLGLLQEHYAQLRFYQMNRSGSAVEKIRRNYFGANPVSEMSEAEARGCEQAFWIVGPRDA